MRVYKRGNIYWYEFVLNRERFQGTTRSKNLRVANQIASTFFTAAIKGEVGIVDRKPPPLLPTAMAAFLAWSAKEHHAHPRTAHRYVVSSKALLKFFRKIPIDKITPEDVERFKAERATAKGQRTRRQLRPATVNRELACLRAMFNHAIKGHPHLRNPVSRVRFLAEENQQDRVVSFAEQRAYLAVATPVLADVAGLIVETGMRPEEVYTLRVASIDLEHRFLRIAKAKTPAGKRQIDLNPEALRILTARIAQVQAGYLFPCEGDPARPIPKVSNAHDRALRDSAVAPFRLYDLRHTWATRAAESGVDLVTLAAMLGHSRIQMVMRYAHPTQVHQTSAVERLAAHNAAREAKERESAANKAAASDNHAAQLHLVPRIA